MFTYTCPCCQQRSVVWYSRAQVFLCRNMHCAASFPPPENVCDLSREQVVRALSRHQLVVTRDWLARAAMHSCPAPCGCELTQLTH